MKKQNKLLVTGSGMLTHLKVADCLKKNDWSVNISSYYYDNVADLVKEIDIVAEKQFNSSDRPAHSSVQVNVQLFIECKYINQDIIFWFDEMNRGKAIDRLQKNTGLRIAEHSDGDIVSDDFHYLKNQKVAKLFSTNSNKEDLVYKAISQCLRAQVYYEQWASGPISNPFNEYQEVRTKIVRYPLVVCGNFDNIKEVQVDTKTNQFSIKDIENSFLLETNYVYFNKAKTATQDDYFLIDFVDIDSLEAYLQHLEQEAGAIVRSSFLSK